MDNVEKPNVHNTGQGKQTYDIEKLQQSDKDTGAQTDETIIMDPQVLSLLYLMNCCGVGGNALEFKMSWHRGRQRRPPKNYKTLSTRLEPKIMS
jgi:hypothetical protein